LPGLSFDLRWRSGLVGGLTTMETVILHGSRLLTPEAHKEFVVGYCTFRACLNSLADRAISRGEVKYHLRPKLHQLGHITFHFLPRNPRYYMNYGGEDTVARVKRIATMAHPVHTSRLTMQRYIIQICLRYTGELVWVKRKCGTNACGNIVVSILWGHPQENKRPNLWFEVAQHLIAVVCLYGVCVCVCGCVCVGVFFLCVCCVCVFYIFVSLEV
jgi:hypothetical protein